MQFVDSRFSGANDRFPNQDYSFKGKRLFRLTSPNQDYIFKGKRIFKTKSPNQDYIFKGRRLSTVIRITFSEETGYLGLKTLIRTTFSEENVDLRLKTIIRRMDDKSLLHTFPARFETKLNSKIKHILKILRSAKVQKIKVVEIKIPGRKHVARPCRSVLRVCPGRQVPYSEKPEN